MMRVEYFNENIEPHLEGYEFTYSTFPEGDFGKLERVEFKGKNKVGAIDFWSQGWVGMDIYDLELDDQVFNLLLDPDEEKHDAIAKLINILNNR